MYQNRNNNLKENIYTSLCYCWLDQVCLVQIYGRRQIHESFPKIRSFKTVSRSAIKVTHSHVDITKHLNTEQRSRKWNGQTFLWCAAGRTHVQNPITDDERRPPEVLMLCGGTVVNAGQDDELIIPHTAVTTWAFSFRLPDGQLWAPSGKQSRIIAPQIFISVPLLISLFQT